MKTHALVVSLDCDYGVRGMGENQVILFDSEEAAVTFAVGQLVEGNVFTRGPDGIYTEVNPVHAADDQYIANDAMSVLGYFQDTYLGASEYFHVFQVMPVPVNASAPKEPTHEQLNSDCTSSEARALHRVVRAMHDGNCPKCGYLGPSEEFQKHYERGPQKLSIVDHLCPCCGFEVSHNESVEALKAFAPYMEQNVEMFEAWRKRRSQNI
jgi:hypothetical protein